jgi:membrane-bound ClpP family serine protease
MSWMLILTIMLIGLILLLLEIMVVPGTTIVGIVGLIMMGLGVYSTYANFGNTAGTLALAGTLIFSITSLALALRSNTWKKAMLSTEMNSKVNEFEAGKVKPGDEGMTITRLNPMGKAVIHNEFYEVTSKDNLIDQNREIIVTKVDGNKIIVKSKSL